MKFKTKRFGIINKVLKYSILVLTLIFTTALLNLFIQSIGYKQVVEVLSNKSTTKIPIEAHLNKVARENVLKVPSSQSIKYKSLSSSLKQNYDDKKRNSSEALLYRKRRYLQFPEGSSLQLVFNILLPIIDYTNYAILGITCALAFELPSKPLSELEDELLQKLHKDSSHHQQHGLSRNDSVLNSKYIDTKHYQNHIKDTFSNLIYVHPSEYQNSPIVLHSNGNKKNFYKNYIPGPYSPSYNQKNPIYYTNNRFNWPYNLKNSKFDAGKPFESFWNPSYSQSPFNRRQDEIPNQKQHAVYHIMGKRSIQETKSSTDEETNLWLNKLDQIHLQYHRSTRHELYSKLEIMFNRQGKNGTECILRALCETGNRRHETEPGELLTEVFRAVFTLPKDLEINSKNYHPMHKARDDAHWNQQNCSEAYPLCENFIWDGNFRI